MKHLIAAAAVLAVALAVCAARTRASSEASPPRRVGSARPLPPPVRPPAPRAEDRDELLRRLRDVREREDVSASDRAQLDELIRTISTMHP